MGPTGAGKSEAALALAEAVGGEILSVDSMQVYRGMDIGTAKPDAEERRRVPHHLIDVADPEEHYSVSQFQQEGRRVLARLEERGTPALIVGGSGLHFRALVDPMEFPPTEAEVRRRLEDLPSDEAQAALLAADPRAGDSVDLDNPRRVVRALEIYELTGLTPSGRATRPEAEALARYESVVAFEAIGLDPGGALAERVEARCDRMLELGLLEEVAALATRLGPTAGQAVGYKELLPVVSGEATLEEGRAEVIRATVALGRRQRTFFRRDPRIRWLPWREDPDERLAAVVEALEEPAWSS